METTELKTFSCKCTEHTCAMIGTKHPLGCCRVHTIRGQFWEEGLEFDDSLFNLDCIPEEAQYISRDAGGYINVWTYLPTKFYSYYSASPALLVESASNTLNWLFKFNTKEEENTEKRDIEEKWLMALLRRPNLYSEYQEGVFIKVKTSDSVYKIKNRQGNYLTVNRVYPTYCATTCITLEEDNRCYTIAEKAPLSEEQMIDLIGKVVTRDDLNYYLVSSYRQHSGSGVFLDTGEQKNFMEANDLLRMEYRTKDGIPCYNFKIKEKM